MNDQIRWLVRGTVCIATAAAIAGCSPDRHTAEKDEQRPAVPVKIVSVVQKEVPRTTTQPATVHPLYRAEIRAKVSGYVDELKADIGDYVEQGDALAVIHVPEMQKQREVVQARISRLEAEEKRARAGIDLAAAKVRAAEARLVQSKSELNRAEASLAAAEAEFQRTEDLVQRQSLQSRVLDEVRKRRDSERANKQSVASAIHSAQADIGVARAEQASAEADLQAAQAETSVAQRQLQELDVLIAYSTLKAPFSGIVTARSLDPGDLVRKSSEVGDGDPLFVLSQVDRVRVQMPVPEKDAAFVNRGDPVTLRFPSFPASEEMTATVTRVAGGLDPSTRTMLVEAEVDNPDSRLLPGMFGQATITLSSKFAANVLPARAVRFDEDGQAYVYVVSPDRTVSVKPITTGNDDGSSIEVLSGVEAGQHVIDAHLKRFSSGDEVTPVSSGT